MLHLSKPLTPPAYGAELLDPATAKRDGIAARYEGRSLTVYLEQPLSVRLTHPRGAAQLESDVRDERYEVAA